MVWKKGSKAICTVGPRSHKASKAEGFRGEARKDIKWVGRNDIRELRHKSGGRWGRILSLRGGIGMRRRRKGKGRVRM
jgi:hypothetical protein